MFFTASSELKRYQREKSWQQVHQMRNELNWKTRSRIFEELYELNSNNWDYLSIYGIELTVHKEYKKAIKVLQQAAKYMKTSDLYTHLGISLEETGDFAQSRVSYETAINMVPHKFYPRYRLVYLYNKMGLEKEALDLAETIVITPAKVNSKIVLGIKYEMRKFIKQHSYE
jgi:tetratricopeptide (TPR) repeat protein